ncbi:hypothetical protein DICVIV_00655 [Dictyocaulus viviparus]|uniref:Pre-rRNA-processing protein Ipi1 N-terminal domain-containing protein n=1 Tax=Dictyocaulus viviparus TaxID=29172 RepID=A0A0D8YAC2_DICVI|nr:hypothetical protein DICVIV_00655 [Dictyocaulus viviparus]
MVTKKKAKKNADFKKVKLKVGKKLKKTSTTDTSIKTKKVVLISQLQEKCATTEKPLSFRGLALDDLCRQLGHFNKGVRSSALVGTKQLLMSNPELIRNHLRTLMPSTARLIPHCGSDPTLAGRLRSIIHVICTAPSTVMAPHFTIFVAHLLHALTHNDLQFNLCCRSDDLFKAFVKFLSSSLKPLWNAHSFLETIDLFIKAYILDKSNCKKLCMEVKLDMCNGEISSNVDLSKIFVQSNPFEFYVTTSSANSTVSPFENPESLLYLCESCAPILAMSLSEDRNGSFLDLTISILSSLEKAASNNANLFLIPDFASKMNKIFMPVKKIASTRKSKRIASATQWLNEF